MGESSSFGALKSFYEERSAASAYPSPPNSAERRQRVLDMSKAAASRPPLAGKRSNSPGTMAYHESGTPLSPPSLENGSSPITPPESPLFTPVDNTEATRAPVASSSKLHETLTTSRKGALPPISTEWTPPLTPAERFVSAVSETPQLFHDSPPGGDDKKRRSVYLPLSGEPRSATIWPSFPSDPHGMSAPKSPSAIHPSYGVAAMSEHDLTPPVGRRLATSPPHTHIHKKSDGPNSRRFYAPDVPLQGLLDNPTFRRAVDSPPAWLALYFLANLGLTLYNKVVLVKFPFPWTLTAVHTLCGSVGAHLALRQELFSQARLTSRENLVLVGFSSLYTINIAVSNLSLNLVTVPFHQVVRAMTPLFTIAVSVVFLRKRYSQKTYFSLVPIIAGVAFATYGDYYFTMWGLILTLLGTLLAALKTVTTNIIQVGRLKLHPLDLLLRMSPLAFMQCVTAAWWTGELERVRAYGAISMTSGNATALFINGFLAFLLNVVSFSANKKTSPLTMTVAANVKQVLTILLAVVMFNLKVTGTNLLGIVLTLGGGMLYAGIEYQEKRRNAARQATASPLSSIGVLTR